MSELMSRDLPEPRVCAICDTDTSWAWERIDGRDYCGDDWFVCEAHSEILPATERDGCLHFTICKGCADEHYCLECAGEDHFWDEVDRQYSMSKEGY